LQQGKCAVNLQISLGYLALRPSVSRFLAGNQRVAQQLGRSGSAETRFVGAVERSSNAGILTGRTHRAEATQSVFRKVTGSSRFGNLFPASSEEARTRHLDISTSSFFASHTELVSLINESPELRKALEADVGTDAYDVGRAIVSVARSRLGSGSPITREHLEQRPQEALLIALNIGGAADLLRDNEDLAQAFVQPPADAWDKVVRSRVAEKAAGMFEPDSPIDEEFLRDHPRTALYLLENPAHVRSLDRNVEKAREFVHTAGALETRLESYVTTRASSLLASRVTFGESTIESVPGFAELLVGDYLTREDGSLVAYINNTVATTPRRVSLRRVLAGQHVRAAAERVPAGVAFDTRFLQDNPGIASLIIGSDEFVQGLSRDRHMVERFVSVPDLDYMPYATDRQSAIAAFSAGYAYRIGTSLDLEA